MFCTHCGQPLTHGARFCAACGAAVVVASISESPVPSLGEHSACAPPASGSVPPPVQVQPEALPPAAPPPLAPPPAAPQYAHPASPLGAGGYPPGASGPIYGSAGVPPLGMPVALPVTAYAGFWRRWWGVVVDRIILNIVLLPIGLALGINMFWPFATHEDMGPEWVAHLVFGSLSMALVRIFAEWVYFAVWHSSSRQATLGQMLLGIYVTRIDGRRVGLGRASGRYFASMISTATLLIGFIMGAFTERRQTLHDMIASTLVLRGRPSAP